MSIIRPLTSWPTSTPTSKKKLNSASQIQYFVQPQADDSEGHVSVFAINILDKKGQPYPWSAIPKYLEGLFKIMAWIQWVFAACYLEIPQRSPLIAPYILYMETLFDELWEAVESDNLKEWEDKFGSVWVQVQKLGGFHSMEYLEKAQEAGRIDRGKLHEVVTDWVPEVDALKNMGFPGAEKLESVKGKFSYLGPARREILEACIKHLGNEERGKFQLLLNNFPCLIGEIQPPQT
jgi:hypothetical protein